MRKRIIKSVLVAVLAALTMFAMTACQQLPELMHIGGIKMTEDQYKEMGLINGSSLGSLYQYSVATDQVSQVTLRLEKYQGNGKWKTLKKDGWDYIGTKEKTATGKLYLEYNDTTGSSWSQEDNISAAYGGSLGKIGSLGSTFMYRSSPASTFIKTGRHIPLMIMGYTSGHSVTASQMKLHFSEYYKTSKLKRYTDVIAITITFDK
jgi:hypothetical protein